ncbi:hypothetical protein CLV98_10769 [Dyadobacter jejuensis]|uniref:Lipocalin-like protein n=1 Tax=Dyadobacter jejuensis TaxID=1082580 RepID=A0A316AI26_9BACT|nr:hypothetical protein [Dyadobacter jejuensis]PWJ57362.1 hypothetical protein CLV98_10769 [Dyadobacter jejuensis]
MNFNSICDRLKAFGLAVLLFIACNGCRPNRHAAIAGTWQTDSISTFVNGLTRTNNVFDAHWSLFEYRADGTVLERRKQQFRTYNYHFVSQDTLAYQDSTGTTIGTYQILKLDEERLVLKKNQKSFLPGANQELYEVRYFSKQKQE